MGPRMHSRSDSMSTPVQILETELLDLVELALQAQQTKWSLVPDVRGESTQMLTEVVAGVWDRADRVAQALRAHGTPPDARIQTVAASPALYPTPSGWLDASAVTRIAQMLGRSAIWARERRDELTDEPDLANLFAAIGSSLDNWAVAVRALSTA